MKTVFSPLHNRRTATTELDGGVLIAPHEKPSRAETILGRVKQEQLGDVLPPEDFGLEPILRVHTPDYVSFLQTCWKDWEAEDKPGEAIPAVWPGRGMRWSRSAHREIRKMWLRLPPGPVKTGSA